jgi:hypothetical protein
MAPPLFVSRYSVVKEREGFMTPPGGGSVEPPYFHANYLTPAHTASFLVPIPAHFNLL